MRPRVRTSAAPFLLALPFWPRYYGGDFYDINKQYVAAAINRNIKLNLGQMRRDKLMKS